MSLFDRISRHPSMVTLDTRATVTESLGFLDLIGWYASDDLESWRERLLAWREPGVHLETPLRMIVIEEQENELRFYAGGAGLHAFDQPNELGVFWSIDDAMLYAEAFLVQHFRPMEIAIQRATRYVNDDEVGPKQEL